MLCHNTGHKSSLGKELMTPMERSPCHRLSAVTAEALGSCSLHGVVFQGWDAMAEVTRLTHLSPCVPCQSLSSLKPPCQHAPRGLEKAA